MFGHFEKALERINRRKQLRADSDEEGLRSEPDWWALAKRAGDVLAADDGEDLGTAVQRLCDWFDVGGSIGYGGASASAMVASSLVERAFMAMRRLRNSVAHQQELERGGVAETDDDVVAAALLLLRLYLEHDEQFTSEYREVAAV
jgi:hypothetical protein